MRFFAMENCCFLWESKSIMPTQSGSFAEIVICAKFCAVAIFAVFAIFVAFVESIFVESVFVESAFVESVFVESFAESVSILIV